MNKKIVVIDLDGTFVNVNTFHKWMKFLFLAEIKRLNFPVVLKILNIIGLRYLNFIDHKKMKFLILRISEKSATEQQTVKFVRSLKTSVNTNILDILKDDSFITILATAAPLLYSKIIKDVYDFDYLVATCSTDKIEWKENIREEKKKNLLLLLEKYSLGNEIAFLYTDHHDDLPLMKYSQHTYLVNASDKTKTIVQKSNIKFDIYEKKTH